MSREEMDKALNKGVAAYKGGLPVVVMSEKGGVLHGEEFMQNIVATGISVEAVVIRHVPVELWNGSNWPEILEAAHLVFFLKRTRVNRPRTDDNQ